MKYEVFFDLLECGSLLLCDVLDKMIPKGNYYSLAEAKRIIMASSYREDRKQELIRFLSKINRNTIVSMYQLKRTKKDKLRIQQLAILGVNPVTIDARSRIPCLSSLYTLLNHVASRSYYAEKNVMYYSFDNKAPAPSN